MQRNEGTIFSSLFSRDYVGRPVDAGCLHVALDVRLQGANLEVSRNAPDNRRHTFGKCEMQFGRFIVFRCAVMLEAVSIAVNAIDVMASDLHESYSGRTLSDAKHSMHLLTARSDFRSLARKLAIVLVGCYLCRDEHDESSDESQHADTVHRFG